MTIKVLEGVRVVEHGTFITGPAASMLLADLAVLIDTLSSDAEHVATAQILEHLNAQDDRPWRDTEDLRQRIQQRLNEIENERNRFMATQE